MDPLTHAALGVACAIAVPPQRPGLRGPAALAGLAAGLLPDADVFLSSAGDPLFFIEYHRHFTHSLAFSPVIALLGAVIAWALCRLVRRRPALRSLLLPAWVAGLSHIACDVWTSYGTRVWWPFAPDRLSWDLVSVIDPLLTVPLVISAVVAWRKGSVKAAAMGLLWTALYLGLATVQLTRARATLDAWVQAENLPPPDRTTVKPSFANIVVWRAMVQQGGALRVIAIRCGLGTPTIVPGPTQPLLATPEAAIAAFGLPPDSLQANDVRRFFHFSDQWVGLHPGDSRILGDLRYAALPHDLLPLWGIRLDPAHPEAHVTWHQFTARSPEAFRQLWQMIRGRKGGGIFNAAGE